VSSSVFEGHPFLGNRRLASLSALDPARGLAAAATAHAILSSNGFDGDIFDGGYHDPLAEERYWRYDRAVRASEKRLSEEITSAYEDAKAAGDNETDVTCPTGTCTEAEEQKKQEEKLKELKEESTLTDDGRTRNFEKEGTLEDAVKDFHSLNPDNVKTFEMEGGGIGFSGKLKDGSTISVRPDSSTGHPTLQHDPVKQWPKTKFRYKK